MGRTRPALVSTGARKCTQYGNLAFFKIFLLLQLWERVGGGGGSRQLMIFFFLAERIELPGLQSASKKSNGVTRNTLLRPNRHLNMGRTGTTWFSPYLVNERPSKCCHRLQQDTMNFLESAGNEPPRSPNNPNKRILRKLWLRMTEQDYRTKLKALQILHHTTMDLSSEANVR